MVRSGQLVRRIIAGLAPESATVERAAEIAGQQYAVLRDMQIEMDVFRPRDMTRERFYEAKYPGIQQQVAFALDQHVANFNLGVELLVGGCDEHGGQLYGIHHPGGGYINMQPIGFSAIGTGQLHAIQSMISLGQSPLRAIAETVFAVYVSKLRAEVAPGVGKGTDLAVVSGTGIAWFDKSRLDKLCELSQDYERPASKHVLQEVAKLF